MTGDTKLKSYYGKDLAILLADKIYKKYPKFQKQRFVEIVDNRITNLELKGRVEVIADTLHELLPRNYKEAVNMMMSILGPPNQNEIGMFRDGYWIMPIAFLVEKYGINDFDISTDAIYQITQRHTGEYAVRPFLIKYPEKMTSLMLKWSQSKNAHVRRLFSEGIRPRLPWAKKLDQYILDPKPILPILENLKEDKSLFVKKSVANNLNDILKDNYNIAFEVLKKWSESHNTNTRWIIKHALRNEIRKDNPEAKNLSI